MNKIEILDAIRQHFIDHPEKIQALHAVFAINKNSKEPLATYFYKMMNNMAKSGELEATKEGRYLFYKPTELLGKTEVKLSFTHLKDKQKLTNLKHEIPYNKAPDGVLMLQNLCIFKTLTREVNYA